MSPTPHPIDGGRRYVAFHLPRIGIERIAIAHRRAHGTPPPPAAILSGEGRGARVVMASAAAMLLGVVPDLSRAEALARAPGLLFHALDPAADCALVDRIADWCDRFTPDVRVDPPDGLTLGFTGDAEGAAAVVEARLAAIGLSTRSAIAANPAAAQALARFQSAPGRDEAASIRRLPLAALQVEDDAPFAVAGLRTVGDLASLPAAQVAARFGRDASRALARLLGDDGGTAHPPAGAGVTLDHAFPEPAAAPAAMKALGTLVRAATAQLADDGTGARRLVARLYDIGGDVRELRIDATLPGPGAVSLMRVFARQAAGLDIAGVDLVRLTADRIAPLASPRLALSGGTAAPPPVRARRARRREATTATPDLFTSPKPER